MHRLRPGPAAVLLTLLTPPGSAAAQSPSPYDSVVAIPVADGIYVARSPEVMRGPNVTFVINDRDVLVVDGSYSPRAARAVIARLRSLTDKPVRYLVNTHAHGDHYWGNQAWVAAFPGIEIIAQRKTAEDIRSQGAKEIQEFVDFAPRAIGSYQRRADRSDGEMAAFFALAAADTKIVAEEARAVTVTPPTLAFTDSLILRRGEREIYLLFLGRGNTEGDAVVFLPREKVVITGDLVVHPTPYGFGSFPRAWVETLRRLDALDFETLVPGHGAVQQGHDYLGLVIDVLAFAVAEVDRAVADSLTRKETRARVSLERFEPRFAGDNELKQFLFQRWFGVVGAAYDEIRPKE